MTENEIYTSYAFSSDATSKADSNRRAYEELRTKYNIKNKMEFDDMSEEERAKVDVVFGIVGNGKGFNLYRIYENKPNLSNLELALLCDDGYLVFDYTIYCELIKIFTD